MKKELDFKKELEHIQESKEVKEGGELFTGGEWEYEFAKWAKGAPTQGFHIMANGRSVCGLNVSTDCPILPRQDSWFNCAIHITPEQAEANAALIAQSKNMYYALKAIVDNWDKRMSGDREVYKEGVIKDAPAYWSPSASMVSSEYIAQARDILNKATPKK